MQNEIIRKEVLIIFEIYLFIIKPIIEYINITIFNSERVILGVNISVFGNIVFFISTGIIFHNKIKLLGRKPAKYILILIIPNIFTLLVNQDYYSETKAILDGIILALVALIYKVIFKRKTNRFINYINILSIITAAFSLFEFANKGYIDDSHRIGEGVWAQAWIQHDILYIFSIMYIYKLFSTKLTLLDKIGVVSLLVGMFLTGHRTGIILLFFQLIIVSIFAIKYMKRNKSRILFKIVIPGLVIICIFSIFASGQRGLLKRYNDLTNKEYFLTQNMSSNNSHQNASSTFLFRLAVLYAVTDEFGMNMHSLLGHGSTMIYKTGFETYYGYFSKIKDAGSAYAIMLYSNGLLKVIVFLLICIVIVIKSIIRLNTNNISEKNKVALITIIAVFISLPLISMTETIFLDLNLGFYFWVIIGILYNEARYNSKLQDFNKIVKIMQILHIPIIKC